LGKRKLLNCEGNKKAVAGGGTAHRGKRKKKLSGSKGPSLKGKRNVFKERKKEKRKAGAKEERAGKYVIDRSRMPDSRRPAKKNNRRY